MSPPTRGFQRLALVTLVLTFALIVLGGVVRVSDSGLGCGPADSGFHGWPRCNGDVIPGASIHTAIEYAHRTVASAVGLLALTLMVLARRRHRAHVRATTGVFALVVAEGLLGGLTVEENLEEELVAAHLGLAMIILALLLHVWRASRPEVIGAPAAPVSDGFRRLAIAVQVLILGTIVAGGYMAGTQKYGRPDYRIGDGAHHACGREFPTCNDGFLPFGSSRLVDIHLTHRVFMYVATVAIVVLVVMALRRRPSAGVVSAARMLGALLVVQLLVGALNVWLEEYEVLILAHLTLGALLWATASMLTLQLYPVRALARA
ncbi:MAG TPA: COX15/CtaA family protein [Candidatus Limnocylindria bacterium]|nr:COX15/CtaA family protein [Candidatus Limnocylindria bacterium]